MKKKVVLLVSSFMFLLLSFMAVNGFYVNQNLDKERHVYAKPLEQVLGSRNLPVPADHEEGFIL